MYSFEGEFRRRPEQNYAGASVHEPVNNLIQRARHEREQREVRVFELYSVTSCVIISYFPPSRLKEARREQRRVVRVQSCVRSFLTRRKIKQYYRTLFDNAVSNLKNKQPSDEVLTNLVRHLVFFHNREIDSQRLVRYYSFFFYASDRLDIGTIIKFNLYILFFSSIIDHNYLSNTFWFCLSLYNYRYGYLNIYYEIVQSY